MAERFGQAGEREDLGLLIIRDQRRLGLFADEFDVCQAQCTGLGFQLFAVVAVSNDGQMEFPISLTLDFVKCLKKILNPFALDKPRRTQEP